MLLVQAGGLWLHPCSRVCARWIARNGRKFTRRPRRRVAACAALTPPFRALARSRQLQNDTVRALGVARMFRVLETLVAPDPWLAVRRPPRHNDEALTGTSRLWLRRLPPRRRPLRLCQNHPRVTNVLAAQWGDMAQTAALLDDLLGDRRGGRRGFPRAVVRELKRLRDFNAQQRMELRPEGIGELLARVVAW